MILPQQISRLRESEPCRDRCRAVPGIERVETALIAVWEAADPAEAADLIEVLLPSSQQLMCI